MCAQIATLFNSVAFWGIADCLPVYLLDDALDYCIAVVSFVSLATWRQVSLSMHLGKNCYLGLLLLIVTIYGRGFGFILIILLLVGFYIQKSYVRFSYTFDRLDF